MADLKVVSIAGGACVVDYGVVMTTLQVYWTMIDSCYTCLECVICQHAVKRSLVIHGLYYDCMATRDLPCTF